MRIFGGISVLISLLVFGFHNCANASPLVAEIQTTPLTTQQQEKIDTWVTFMTQPISQENPSGPGYTLVGVGVPFKIDLEALVAHIENLESLRKSYNSGNEAIDPWEALQLIQLPYSAEESITLTYTGQSISAPAPVITYLEDGTKVERMSEETTLYDYVAFGKQGFFRNGFSLRDNIFQGGELIRVPKSDVRIKIFHAGSDLYVLIKFK